MTITASTSEAASMLTPTVGPLNIGMARTHSGRLSCSARTMGTSTKMPQRPYTMEGIAASSSVRKMSGERSQNGQMSDRNTAMPIATGVEIASARIDEYNVPQMNGKAPKSPCTGSHALLVQNENPNARIDSSDCCHNTTAMPTTSSTTTSASAPVTPPKSRSPALNLRPVIWGVPSTEL